MSWYEDFDKLAVGIEVLSDEPMSAHTTFRIGGPARRFAKPGSIDELVYLLELAHREGWPVYVIGNGSDLLAADEGIDALVISMGRLTDMERKGDVISAGAGSSLASLSSFAAKEGLAGLAFAHGIPGSVGGAVRMNAGAYGGEMKQVVSAVDAWFPDSGVERLTADELDFGYRHSVFDCRPGAVLKVEVLLRPGDTESIRADMRDYDCRRREKQPLEMPSAGSVFKRPTGYFAGALIQHCGLKGASVGGARVSEKHAGFIVNTGGATCRDVLGLIKLVQKAVLEQTGVALEPEIKILR